MVRVAGGRLLVVTEAQEQRLAPGGGDGDGDGNGDGDGDGADGVDG